MYAKEMTTGDIETHLKELYDRDISDSTISCITDKIMPLLTRNLFYSLFYNIRNIMAQLSRQKSEIFIMN